MFGKLKQVLIQAFKLGAAVGLIAWLVHRGALNFAALERLATPWHLLALGLWVLALILINNHRWLILMRGQNLQTTVWQTVPLSFIGLFFNYAMPGGVGGDVVKGYYLVQDHPQKRLAAALSIFMDRLIGFFVMVVTAAVALFFDWDRIMSSPALRPVAFIAFAMSAGFIVFFVLAFSPSLQKQKWLNHLFHRLPGGSHIAKIYENIHAYRKAPKAFLLSLLLSFISNLCMVLFVYCIGHWMGETELPFATYMFLVPIGVVTMALPIAPAGIGIGQASFYYLFNSSLGHVSELGPTAITAFQVVQLLWAFVGVGFYLQRKRPQVDSGRVDQRQSLHS
jgi:uncharacterized protein (TIRG00374 family)